MGKREEKNNTIMGCLVLGFLYPLPLSLFVILAQLWIPAESAARWEKMNSKRSFSEAEPLQFPLSTPQRIKNKSPLARLKCMQAALQVKKKIQVAHGW